MFIAVRRLCSVTVLLALAVSCQGPGSDPDPTQQLPPISDWPKSGVDNGSFDPSATPPAPGTQNPAPGATGGVGVPVVPSGSAGAGGTSSLDAGSAVRDAGTASAPHTPGSGDAGFADAQSPDAEVPDGGSSDGGNPDGGNPDASSEAGCPIRIAPDAGPCFGHSCFFALEPWRPDNLGACTSLHGP